MHEGIGLFLEFVLLLCVRALFLRRRLGLFLGVGC
jgi:hypothetical protein